jgi:hypothetical protein
MRSAMLCTRQKVARSCVILPTLRGFPMTTQEEPGKTFEQLCLEASVETDTQKLLALTQQINKILEEREKQQKTSAA